MPQWTPDVCRANGIDMHYLRTGGPGPPLVMLHGLTDSGACWSPVARALEGGVDVVMPDARGHGGSDAPERGYGYAELAADAMGLIRGLGLASPVLVGHSMGGMTAALVASRASGLLRGVVLVDPTFLGPRRQREVFQSDVAARHRRLLGRDMREVVVELRQRHPRRDPGMIELLARARLATRMQAFDVLAPPLPDYRELVRATDIPILLVLAEHGVVSLDTARALRRINPLVRIERIEDVGHGLPYDQPERLAAVVRSFLASNFPP